MKEFPIIGLGIASKGASGKTLDTFFPCISFKNGENKYSQYYKKWDSLMTEDVTHLNDASQLDLQDQDLHDAFNKLDENKTLVLCRIIENKPIESIEEAYLKLHLISYRYFVPKQSLPGILVCKNLNHIGT